MKIRRTILGLLAFASLQTASATDLMQIYQQALMNDTQFAAAQLRYKALRLNSPIARSLLLPRVNLCSNHVHHGNGVTTLNGPQRDPQ